jgi:hypothetical protein
MRFDIMLEVRCFYSTLIVSFKISYFNEVLLLKCSIKGCYFYEKKSGNNLKLKIKLTVWIMSFFLVTLRVLSPSSFLFRLNLPKLTYPNPKSSNITKILTNLNNDQN